MHKDKLSLAINLSTLDSTGTINLSGCFSYRDRSAFESKYAILLNNAGTEKLIVDLAEVERIDSSALGMLLVLRNHAEARQKSLHLANPSAAVRNVFEVACFPKIFNITG